MRVTLFIAAAAVTLATVGAAGQQQTTSATPPTCRAAGSVVQVAELPEGSGVAASRRINGRLWTHNDSGRPVLIALDDKGRVSGQLAITGAAVEDWEAIAVGPCGSGSCIYIADIGDNGARRSRISIYRVAEPDASATTAAVTDVLHATYPDGPRDAETLLVTPDGTVYIVTKAEESGAAVYRFAAPLRPGGTHKLERVGASQPNREGDDDARAGTQVTDGAVSPDGAWVALRTNDSLTFYRASDFFGGSWRAATTVDLKNLDEPQGEGVAFGADGTVYLVGESGGKGGGGGTFATLSCSSM